MLQQALQNMEYIRAINTMREGRMQGSGKEARKIPFPLLVIRFKQGAKKQVKKYYDLGFVEKEKIRKKTTSALDLESRNTDYDTDSIR